MLSPVRFLTRPTARQRAAAFAAIASAAVLAASVADAAERGACLSMTQTSSRTANDVDKMVANFGVEAQLFSAAQCGVDLYRITYQTVAPDGTLAVASAGMVVPTQCTGPYPLVEYNHGTWTTTGLEMSDPKMRTAQEVSAQFGGQGYAAVMPDYLGYASSSLDWHPYLHAVNNADVTMDAVRATRVLLADSPEAIEQLEFHIRPDGDATGPSRGGSAAPRERACCS